MPTPLDPNKPASSGAGESDRASRDRALAALHSLAKPQPRPEPVTPPEKPEPLPNSASGFVGMLAKGQGAGDTQFAFQADGVEGKKKSSNPRYSLEMAREIPAPAEPRKPAMSAAARKGRGASGNAMARVVLVLGILLLLIGLWAAGAAVYMLAVQPVAPEDVHYPLIRWSLDVGNDGGYTAGSRVMAWGMLLALPVGIGFVWLSRVMGRIR